MTEIYKGARIEVVYQPRGSGKGYYFSINGEYYLRRNASQNEAIADAKSWVDILLKLQPLK